MITDQTRILHGCPGAKVKAVQWLKKVQGRDAPKVNKADGVNIHDGLTCYGVAHLLETTGTSKLRTSFKTLKGDEARAINKDDDTSTLSETFLRDGQVISNHHRASSWLLQQDGNKAHAEADKSIKRWSRQSICSKGLIKNWPSNSPDLIPIENLWSWTELHIQARGCKTFETLDQQSTRSGPVSCPQWQRHTWPACQRG